MSSDDESTRTMDVATLRRARANSIPDTEAEPPTQPADDETLAASSITRVDVAPASGPGTYPATELLEVFATETRSGATDIWSQTDESGATTLVGSTTPGEHDGDVPSARLTFPTGMPSGWAAETAETEAAEGVTRVTGLARPLPEVLFPDDPPEEATIARGSRPDLGELEHLETRRHHDVVDALEPDEELADDDLEEVDADELVSEPELVDADDVDADDVEPDDVEPDRIDAHDIDPVDTEDLGAVDDLDRTGAGPVTTQSAPPHPAEITSSLPRWPISSNEDIVLSPSQGDVELLSESMDVVRRAPASEPPTSRGDATIGESFAPVHQEAITAAPILVRPSIAPAPALPSYVPPAPVGRGNTPAYAIDTDDDEDQLVQERSFRALVDLHRLRIADAPTPAARATLLHKIASVYEHELGEPQQAFETLAEAFDLRPADDDLVASLDRVARSTGRVGEIAERARKNLHTADIDQKIILLGHLVHWYERVLGRGSEIGAFVGELERLDKAHPILLRRAAQVAAANGDVKTQRELLARALERAARREDKVALHLALAGAHAGTPEAARHYEAAVANDPTSMVALQGLERVGREQNKHAQVAWCLEREVEVAETSAERVDALLKLAELHETKFLRRDIAAEYLERVIDLEPAHPQGLKALERCYHALRDWPRLVRVLRMRADNTYDKKQKVELLELAAEVHESKLDDLEAAVEVHRDLLVVDPQHKRALGDLARLYEKLGDWGNMSTYKSRVAELAPTKRQASQLLVQLGDFLNHPDRDAVAARMQYERAVTVDPANASAWEALQRVAAAAGDDRRVAQCLEQRARTVDGPRQRAAIYVELGNLYASARDERAAREAFENATQADPTNESAAIAMLDVFSREERWAEAQPLCELLVNAATRDKDPRALFSRLRLSTRISAALGDADRAMSSALGAIEIQPDDEGAQSDLVLVCSQCRDNPRVVLRAKEWLSRIARGPAILPTSVLVGLAQLQRDAGELEDAAATLENALARDPDHPDLLRELADVYLAQRDYPRACQMKIEQARNAISADVRFQLLCDVGDIWARRANDLEAAAPIFEEARAIKPLDHWLLHTLMWLYGEMARWTELPSVLEAIAQIQESPDRKAKSFFAMAQVVLEKVGDPHRAGELFDQVLELDPTRLDAFEHLVRALTEAKDWEQLELFYRKMIARVKDGRVPPGTGPADLELVLFRQLGLVYRDRLEDAERAYEALEYAARLKPEEPDLRRMVTELLVVTDNLDTAVMRIRELIAREPHEPELYAELYDLFLRQHDFDRAWCAVNVLFQMREGTPEQRQFHEDYAPMRLDEVPGQIVEQAWQSHLLHADLDPTLTKLFARMAPAVARMRLAALRPEQAAYAAGRPFVPQHSRLYEEVRATFANAAEILQLPPPDLLLGDPGSPVPFAPALVPFGAVLAAVPAIEARADALVYVIGKRLAEQRPELIARAYFPSTSELSLLLAAAARVSRQERAKDAAGAQLDANLAAHLMPQERDAVRTIIMQAAMDGGLVDVKRWSQAADLSSMRAGLLLSGDVGPARRIILAEPQSTADLTPREKIAELYQFAISDLYGDLRRAIGVAVED